MKTIHSTLQLINLSNYQPINLSTFQPINPSTYQPFNQSTLQPINPSTYHPINQSAHQARLFNRNVSGPTKTNDKFYTTLCQHCLFTQMVVNLQLPINKNKTPINIIKLNYYGVRTY